MQVKRIESLAEYKPLPAQADFHRCPAKYPLYGGAMAGGKSIAICVEAIMLGLEYPGNSFLIGRKSLKDLKRTTMRTFFEYLPRELIATHNKTDGIVTIHNGSEFIFSDLDDPGKLKSLNLGGFAIDEATEVKKEAFLMLTSRLRRNIPGIRYKGLLATNPEPGWVKDMFITNKLADHAYIPASPRDNFHLPQGYLSDMERDFPAIWRAKYLEGSWDDFGGRIFDPKYLFPTKKTAEGLWPDFAVKFTTVDPAISDDYEACETAIVTCGISYEDGLIHEIETIHDHFSFNQTIEQIVAVNKRHSPQLIGVERVAYQRALEESLRDMGMSVVGLTPDGDKIRRAIGVSNMVERGQVRVNSEYLRAQLIEFPKGTLCDCVDAFVWCLRMIREMSGTKFKRQDEIFRGLSENDVLFWKNFQEEKKKIIHGDPADIAKTFEFS